ncbi:hypothetical protein BN4901_4051 [Citrobacter europaeus]|uniref:Uncharacterized protein n=1 Tax=Citrobacter europaeus TaxID=1914243 RepID=A0ABY0JUD3_9ENTR|nr:hypothetical protein BN4901_4051 [Citrobacter europaeus]
MWGIVRLLFSILVTFTGLVEGAGILSRKWLQTVKMINKK